MGPSRNPGPGTSKSHLVAITVTQKALRRLGVMLTETGALPDPDAVFFLTLGKLSDLISTDQTNLPSWQANDAYSTSK